MSLIDATYFYGPINIPSSIYKSASDYINRYEPKILNDLFGYSLALEISAYDSSNPGDSDQRIRDIVEGKEFTPTYPYDSGSYFGTYPSILKWNGLINSEKISLIAYWVFYWYMREEETKLSISGSGKSKGENNINIGDNAKAVYAWREMLKLYGGSRAESPVNPSCFQFMYANQSTYPEWVFKQQGSINRLGL